METLWAGLSFEHNYINFSLLQGRIFLMTEAVSQFCRGLAPIQPWLIFLLDSYSGSEKVKHFIFPILECEAKSRKFEYNNFATVQQNRVDVIQKLNFDCFYLIKSQSNESFTNFTFPSLQSEYRTC